MKTYELRFIDYYFDDNDDVRGELLSSYDSFDEAEQAKNTLLKLGTYDKLDLVIVENEEF